MTTYRKYGAISALLDEYEKALNELKTTIVHLEQDQLLNIFDSNTPDPDCRSIQSILTHVIQSGYQYVIAMRNHCGEELNISTNVTLNTVKEYTEALDIMYVYNVQFFTDYPSIALEEHDPKKKINVSWGQKYDVEQLFEHAIVHILRHRRQIEKFLAF